MFNTLIVEETKTVVTLIQVALNKQEFYRPTGKIRNKTG